MIYIALGCFFARFSWIMQQSRLLLIGHTAKKCLRMCELSLKFYSSRKKSFLIVISFECKCKLFNWILIELNFLIKLDEKFFASTSIWIEEAENFFSFLLNIGPRIKRELFVYMKAEVLNHFFFFCLEQIYKKSMIIKAEEEASTVKAVHLQFIYSVKALGKLLSSGVQFKHFHIYVIQYFFSSLKM